MSDIKKYCVANWKMYIHSKEITRFIKTFNRYILNNDVEIVLCPNYIDLYNLNTLLSNSNIKIGSQNISINKNGAYTGDISLDMLVSANCKFSIIGHSERRYNYNESDLLINKKLKILNNSSINPIICIGETIEEKESGDTFDVINHQLNTIFNNVDILEHKDYLIAYEPRWAIGTGVAADMETIKSVCSFIKNIIKTIDKNYCNLYLLYGGSVSETNASEILKIEDVDGFLIGSSSIKPEKFYKIYNKF